jgi:glycosyltransferase involved in cell wall biosynthesis
MRLTILSLAYPFAPAGDEALGSAERVLASIDRALVEERHASLVLATEGSHLRGTVLTHMVPARVDDDAQRVMEKHYRRKVAQITGALRVDVVHAHTLDFVAYLPPSSMPLVVTLHQPLSSYPRAVFELARPRTAFVCVSQTQRAGLPRVVANVCVIGNGVRLDAFTPSTQPINERRYVLVVARANPGKGIHLAVEAARRADVDLVIAGEAHDGDERYFAERVAPLLDARRRYVGPVRPADKRALLAGARCVLVPSVAPEASSLVAMEALASGTPVVAFRSGALPEIVEHGRTGFVVTDAEEMATAIGWVDELSSETCRAAAERRFDARVMTASYLALYEELVGLPASAVTHQAHA